ncbi:Sialic acid TRAP transporter large permease protein SiaM OS=Lysinibacillus sphaericus OX=1421 GN=siaM PE=4 SV=1 [Lysinibacillus sphaericus]
MTKQHERNTEVKEEFEQISAEAQQAILEKYDIESNVRTISGIMKLYNLLWIIGIFIVSIVYSDFWAIYSTHSTDDSLRVWFSSDFLIISSFRRKAPKHKNCIGLIIFYRYYR